MLDGSGANTTSKNEGLTFKKRVNPNTRALVTGKNPYYTSPKNPFQYYNASRPGYGNCTHYAYGRFMEIWGTAPESEKKKHPWKAWTSFPNACRFYSAAKSAGYKTGLVPKPGAIGVWGYGRGETGDPGHVVIVEEVFLDKNNKVESIEISNSGWSSGDLPNRKLYPGSGGTGFNAWKLGYTTSSGNPYFVGFIYNPITFKGSNGTMSGVTGQATTEDAIQEAAEEAGVGIDFQKRASKLVSSDNYSFIKTTEETKKKDNSTITAFTAAMAVKQLQQTFQSDLDSQKRKTLQNVIDDTFTKVLNKAIYTTPKIIKRQAFLSLGKNVVEAPFIELTFANNYTIGTCNGNIDKYPNYISDLQVSRQNGIINQYVIKLIHQIRPGDDSNLLDELFSTTNYDKITIKYGDANAGSYFQDMNAMITNISMNRSYTSMSISYTLEATSEGEQIKTYTTNFPEVTDTPSNVLYNLIYNRGEISKIIQDTFPGMRNKTFVASNNLIPTTDAVVSLDAQQNTNIIDYINYLVGSMSNKNSGNEVIRNSTYYATFIDNDPSNPDGSYIKVNEVTADLNPYAVTDKIYDITVGYPQDIVYSFTIDDTSSWELLYKNGTKSVEYFYTITNNGDIERYYSPSLTSSMEHLSEINKNWWTQMVKFPLTAQLTVKGLLKPIMLMDYINVSVMFYGQEHISSGVYAITGQTDFLSGTGYRTTLSLVRVGSS